MNFDLKNMMLACLGHLNIQWDWPRCPSSWHSRHLYPFVMLNFQCLVASSLGQSMPHSCSFKDPMCFPFSNSGYMPATKIKSLHSTAGSENIWQLCCQKLFHTIQRSQFQRQMWDQAQNHFKETKPVNTLRPCDSFCFLLVSSHFFYPNFKRPIPSQKWILKQQVQLNIPKHSTKITCQCRNPFRHLARATPRTMRKPFRGHGRRCGPRPPWPLQRSAARPRRHGLCQPPNAAPSGLGRRGCDADGGAVAAAVEKQSV